jgi:hypothetical protein
MGRTNLCSETCATEAIPANVGGTHGGINPRSRTGTVQRPSAHGSSGNPGTEFPWEGADSTRKPGELPPLKSL